MIAQGKIKDEIYIVQRLTRAHVAQINELQDAFVATLPDANMLQPLDEDELSTILNGDGFMLGVFVDERLIAFRALLDPLDDDEHLGIDANVPQAKLHQVIYQEISGVHPEYQGNGLQKTLAPLVMAQLDTKKYRYVCATVMPFNIASLKDKFIQGFHVVNLKLKYGGKLRYVFFKDLEEKPRAITNEKLIVMSDIAAQQQLLQEGYTGVDMVFQNEEWHVRYVK